MVCSPIFGTVLIPVQWHTDSELNQNIKSSDLAVLLLGRQNGHQIAYDNFSDVRTSLSILE